MKERATILAVDDEERNLRLMEAMLCPMGHDVVVARDGEDALRKVEETPPDLILMDVMMPRMDGFEATQKLKADEKTKSIPIVIVTALNDLEDRVHAIEMGADDFLSKPVEQIELRARVNSLLKVKAYYDYVRDYQKQLECEVDRKTRQLKEAFKKAKLASLDTFIRLCRAAEFKDEETGNHIRRISQYAAALAQKIGMKNKEVEQILYSAPMHDIGKIGIPEQVLIKKGDLNPAEWEIMKQHTTIGARILSGSDGGFIKLAEVIALTHHERWNGSGYPEGIKAEDIPLAGRITAIADVFDALTSARPYRKPVSMEEAFEFIKKGSGNLFDPKLVDAFVTLGEEIIAIRNEFKDDDESFLLNIINNLQSYKL